MRGLVVTFAALLIVVGCGRVPSGPAPAAGYKVYEAATTGSTAQLSIIDSRSHAVDINMPLGTPSPDWTHLYTLTGNTLVDLDPRSGATRRTLRLPGYYELPPANFAGVPGGLSQDGRWLVLESFDNTNTIPSATHLLLVDTSYSQPPRQIDIKGFFNFDAVSNDGQRIFVIQYVSTTEYYVRRWDVGSSQLNPTVIFDKADGSAAMGGLRLSGVPSPDGHWLYSVYIRQDQSAFIHVLSLDDSLLAYCVDLPGSGYASDMNQFHWSLALSPDGTHLYAANGATGVVADVNTWQNEPPAITRLGHVGGGAAASTNGFAIDAQAKEFAAYGAAVSPDGKTLVVAGSTGVVWIDTANLHVQDRQLEAWRVWSLALSPDGTTLYAVNDAGMIAEVPMAGSHSTTTFGGAAGQPMALVRVEAAAGA